MRKGKGKGGEGGEGKCETRCSREISKNYKANQLDT